MDNVSSAENSATNSSESDEKKSDAHIEEASDTAQAKPKTSKKAKAAEPEEEYTPNPVTVKSLLEAGAHYGHQTQRWNPKMLPYIFGERNRIHIINLDITNEHWQRAEKFLREIASRGGQALFVGTKRQAKDSIERAAKRSGSYFITTRWLGGTLSNFKTIRNSISRMRKIEELLQKAQAADSDVKLNKKERLGMSKQLGKFEANLGGIREMTKLPSVLFVVDILKESIAVAEARKLHIPIVALVDTNADPKGIDYPIPSNDDAVKTIKLFADAVGDALLEGRKKYESNLAKERQREKKEAAEPKGKVKASSSKSEEANASAESASVG